MIQNIQSIEKSIVFVLESTLFKRYNDAEVKIVNTTTEQALPEYDGQSIDDLSIREYVNCSLGLMLNS